MSIPPAGVKRLGLGWCLLAAGISAPSWAQSPARSDNPPTAAPSPRTLAAEDARLAEQRNQEIEKDLQAGRWAEAIASAEGLHALRAKVQGPKHFETVSEEWRLKALRQVSALPEADHAAFLSSNDLTRQANFLYARGRYAEAHPLYEEALAIRRRLLTDDHPLAAESMGTLAQDLDAQLKYGAAGPLHEEALAIRRRLLSEDHPDTATAYNNLAFNLYARGKPGAAQPLLEKALAIRRRLLTDDHPSTVISYNALAVNLNAQGKYAEAQPLLEKVLAVRRRLLTDDHPNTATSYNNLAANLDSQGRFAEAQLLYEKALAIRRRLLTEDHPQTAASYHNLAVNLADQAQYGAAQPLLEKALAIRRRLFTDDHPDTAATYGELAANLADQGKYGAAQPLFEKALMIRRRFLTDDHPATATSYNNLAVNLNAQGKYAEAQPLYEEALAIRRRLLTDEHPDTATSYNNVAYNLSAQGRYAEAQPLYEKALAIDRRLLTEDHPQTAIAYNNMAGNLEAQGKYDEAQPLYEKALAIDRRLLTDDHPATAIAYNNLGLNLALQGRYAEAQPLYEKSLEIRRRLFGEDHPKIAASYHNVAANLADQGKYDEARDQWLRAARSSELARLTSALTGLDRATAATGADPLLRLAAVLARLGQPAEAWQHLEEGFGRGLLDELAAREDRRFTPQERAELQRRLAELERLDRLFEAPKTDLNQAERRKRLEDLLGQRDRARIALGELRSQLVQKYGPQAGQVAKLREIQASLPADAALVAWVDLKPPGPNAADPDGEHWGAVLRARGAPAWVRLPGTGPGRHWTAGDTDLASRVREGLIRRPGAGSADVRPMLRELRAQRLGPLAEALGPTPDGLPAARRLIVLPSPALAGIPIEALLEPEDHRTVSYAPSATVLGALRGRPPVAAPGGLLALGDPVFEDTWPSSDPDPLPEHGLLLTVVVPGSNAESHGLRRGDVMMSYDGRALHSGNDLRPVQGPGPEIPVDVWKGGQVTRRRLGRGQLGVVVDPRPAATVIREQRRLDRVLIAARSGSEHFGPLPGTRLEVQALARSFADARRPVRLLTGSEASEPALDRLASSGDLGRFAYIHLATHGVIDEAVPLRSAVVLAQTGLPDPLDQMQHGRPIYDGRLSVHEIQRGWELNAELVTLSACETARGPQARGEGFIGFSQALLMSGARGVCLSLWKVNDVATGLLMRRFYANLLGRRQGLTGPMPKAEALAEAKRWLRGLGAADVPELVAQLTDGVDRGKGAQRLEPEGVGVAVPTETAHPFAHPYYWAAFVLVGDPG
jgi:tetratricopeptide (TPR) repeat protein